MAKVFLIHGWSVRSTETYRSLHRKLAEHGHDLHDVFLGRYVSLDDDIEIRDISKAMHRELVRILGKGPWKEPFHMVTHSTGALVVKDWLFRYYDGKLARSKPLGNLVFLAGPHFGSRLAHHGRSMLSHVRYLGDTGKLILRSLELGSEFSWDNNAAMLDPATWKDKGVRPYCLIGDKVDRNPFASRIFPAHYERGSDMVVRVPAANLNFVRMEIDAAAGTANRVGEISGVPFAALARYTHSGKKSGILNSIGKNADATKPRYQNLDLIQRCLDVTSTAGYGRTRRKLAEAHAETRARKPGFAQLDFRFRDDQDAPIDDYLIELGYCDDKGEHASRSVEHIHKNKIDPSHFTAFIEYRGLDPGRTYFMRFQAQSGSPLYHYRHGTDDPERYRHNWSGTALRKVITMDQTTQIDVVLSREPSSSLFVFHAGDSGELHVQWNRRGEIKKEGLSQN